MTKFFPVGFRGCLAESTRWKRKFLTPEPATCGSWPRSRTVWPPRACAIPVRGSGCSPRRPEHDRPRRPDRGSPNGLTSSAAIVARESPGRPRTDCLAGLDSRGDRRTERKRRPVHDTPQGRGGTPEIPGVSQVASAPRHEPGGRGLRILVATLIDRGWTGGVVEPDLRRGRLSSLRIRRTRTRPDGIRVPDRRGDRRGSETRRGGLQWRGTGRPRVSWEILVMSRYSLGWFLVPGWSSSSSSPGRLDPRAQAPR